MAVAHKFSSMHDPLLTARSDINIFNDQSHPPSSSSATSSQFSPSSDMKNFYNDALSIISLEDHGQYSEKENETNIAVQATQNTEETDPLEQLLMTPFITDEDSTISSNFYFNFMSTNNDMLYCPPSFQTNSSSTSALVSDAISFCDNDSRNSLENYDGDVDAECNSLQDFSSMSNIIYTNKVKEKLRRKRQSSADLLSTTEVPSYANSLIPTTAGAKKQSKVTKMSTDLQSSTSSSTLSLNLSLQSNSVNISNRPTLKLRSKSLGFMSLSPSHGGISPGGRATNPFYQPPAILKNISNFD